MVSATASAEMKHVAALAALFFVAWTAHASVEIGERLTNTHKPVLCSTSRSMDVVLSYFQEDTAKMREWLDRVLVHSALPQKGQTFCVICYVKGSESKAVALMPELPHVDYFICTPNVGREGFAYLHYITANYARLPAYMLFSQAIPNNMHRHMISSLRHFSPGCSQFLCLGTVDQ